MAQIVYRGGTYPVIDPVEWQLGEAAFIKRQTGQAVGEIARNAALSDAEAIVALIYVAKKRAGEKVRWEDFEDFTVGEIDYIFEDERADDEDETETDEGGADPTSPSGTTPAAGNSNTSTRSRSTTTSTRGKSKS